jgi:hypothetical protein
MHTLFFIDSMAQQKDHIPKKSKKKKDIKACTRQ